MRRTQFLAVLASTAFSLLVPTIRARAQAAAPAQFFWVCYSAGNTPNTYVSGILQGPATAAAAFRVGFVQVLMQRYSYQGNANCVPARTAINAQDDLNRRAAALRNAKKNVVETGWTEAAPATLGASGAAGTTTNPLSSLLGGATAPAAAPTNGGQVTNVQNQVAAKPSGANTAQGGGTSGGSTTVSVLDALFGASPPPTGAPAGAASGSTGTAAAGAKPAQGQAAGKTASTTGTNGSPAVQVASTLSGLFKGSSNSAPGGAANVEKPGAPDANGGGKGASGAPAGASTPGANTPGGLPQGALGSAQFGNTMLVVYGCGRQGTSGTQVLCVTDLTNQNQKDTLVQSDAVWKDAFIVDDRGDRHTRTNSYFLNIDGEQRQQLDIDYGKSAHFILAFDGIPAKVEKIQLRSSTGGLNVNAIPLIAVDASSDASAQAQPAAH